MSPNPQHGPETAPRPAVVADDAPRLLANPRRSRLAHVRTVAELRELTARGI